ncbi:MAG: BRCT domain-containing protein [Myxococcota bacterium]
MAAKKKKAPESSDGFPFRRQFSPAQMRDAKRNSSWMRLLCSAIAEECGIDGVPQTPYAWMGTHPTSRTELCAKLKSVRVVRSGKAPFHRITMELAAFNGKGACVAWNEGPVTVTFVRDRKLVLLSDGAKKALADLTRKGLAPATPKTTKAKSKTTKAPKTTKTTKTAKSKSPKAKSKPTKKGKAAMLDGASVVVTGTFEVPRASVEADLRKAGALVKSSVSSRTDLLVCGRDAGSKLAKAKALKLPIWSEKEMRAALKGSGAAKKTAKKTAKKRSSKTPAPLRPAFEAMFVKLAKRGVHFEVLNLGKPARASSLDKMESKVLEGPLDPALRSFFEEMDGLQCCYWIDPLAATVRRDAPKPKKKRLPWSESTNAFSALWKKINGIHNAWVEADCPARDDGEEFVLGLINIPDHKTMFTTDWGNMLCLDPGEFLFDANHHYRGEYLAYEFDSEANRQESLVTAASDHFAARYDHGGVTVARYFKALIKRRGEVEF